MAGNTFIRINKITTLTGLNKVCEHNTRHEGERTPSHIDTNRGHLNEVLIGTMDDNFSEMYKTEINSSDYCRTHKIRKDAVIAVEAEIYYPGNVNNGKELNRWKELTTEFVCKRFGKENVKNVVMHMDESRPHIHAVFIPMYENKKGEKRLSCSHFISGPAELSKLQTEYANYIKELGYKRGVKFSGATHQEMKKVHTVVHQAFSNEPPEIRANESAKEYRERISEEWRDLYAKGAILENEKTRNGDMRNVNVRKDKLLEEKDKSIDTLQQKNIQLQDELYEYKKKDYLLQHGLKIHPKKDELKPLIDELTTNLTKEALDDIEKNNIDLENLLNE